MRRFYQVSKAGSLKNIILLQSQIPIIKQGQVLVEVKSIGLNYADLFAIMGLYSATPKGPFIPGLEFSGVVVHSEDPRWPRGSRVIGVTRFGGYDTHIVADPQYLIALPEAWSFDEGAAFPVQTLTAYYALVPLGNIKHAQTVLIHSAAGGVGLQAHRIAKKYNAFTIGVVGHQQKFELLKKEGFDGMLTRSGNFREELQQILAGRELNIVLEASGGTYFRHSYRALSPMGRLIAYGSAQFTPSSNRPNYLALGWKYLFRPRIDPLSMIPANKSVMGFNLIWLYERHMLLHELLKEIDALQLPAPYVGHRFSFENLPEALATFKSGTTKGKVVVQCD